MTRQEVGEALDRWRQSLWWELRIGNFRVGVSKVNCHIVVSWDNTVIWATRSDRRPKRPQPNPA